MSSVARLALAGSSAARRSPVSAAAGGPRRHVGDLLNDGCERERAGCLREAVEAYNATIAIAEQGGHQQILAEALRRLAILRYREHDVDAARALCHRSFHVATAGRDEVGAAEALNTLATIDLHTGRAKVARTTYERALKLAGHAVELRACIERNIDVLTDGTAHDADTFMRAVGMERIPAA